MKHLRLIFCLGLLAPVISPLYAQSFKWAVSMGGNYIDDSYRMTQDISGNLIVAGHFSDTAYFNNPGQPDYKLFSSGGVGDVFIAKYSSLGQLLWAKSAGGYATDKSYSVTSDKDENVFVTGFYSGSADFNTGPDTLIFKTVANAAVFLLKLDKDGNFKWAVNFANQWYCMGMSVATDESGYVYLTGMYSDTIDFDPGPETYVMSSEHPACFVVKLDPMGHFVWAKQLSGTGNCQPEKILISKGQLFICGSFRNSVDFDPDITIHPASADSLFDAFLVRLDTAANFKMLYTFGGKYDDIISSFCINKDQNIILTGSFGGTVNFNPGNNPQIKTSAGKADFFISMIDSNGTLIWNTTIGNTEADYSYGISSDIFGGIYISGFFANSVDFDPGPGVYTLSNTLPTKPSTGFIAKYDGNGRLIWAHALTGGGGCVYDILAAPNGNLYASGQFTGIVDFNPKAGFSKIKSRNSLSDVFLLKWSQGSVGINENAKLVAGNFYPNPSDNLILISLNKETTVHTIEIVNSQGQTFQTQYSVDDTGLQLKLPEQQGVYYIRLTTEDGVISQKVIRN